MINLIIINLLCSVLIISCISATGVSTIKVGEQLNLTSHIVSPGNNFTLGSFVIPVTNYIYFGIWYTNDEQSTKVWVANPSTPIILRNSSVLMIDPDTGKLIISVGGIILVNISDNQSGPDPNLTATLEDTGDFQLKNGTDNRILWRSFDYPTNVLLPGMKLGSDLRAGKNWNLTSWKTDFIPDSGAFTLSWEPIGESSQRFMVRKRGQPYWSSGEGSDLMVFSFDTIVAATNDFSSENKLGEGGFGPVYKGKLSDGQEIAIKRLSRTSGQGLVEFKNELVLIAKLQHTNLVRVLGCCIRREEKMLIYEYMPNKSLDFFLFDETKRALLDWPKRWNIIEGISQGLLYLHKYSRMRVIHRDLKASNVLLDGNMKPKISDFGMARIFKQNETEAMTSRVVGTYGYMSPEYAMEGTFSEKSDVYSFGVLVLEIVSGRKNTSFFHIDKTVNLIGYAWELWQHGDALQLEDPTLANTCVVQQLLRTIHVALLCVQENASGRPFMSDVISMLINETMLLPSPKRPAFFIGRTTSKSTLLDKKSEDYSVNNITITQMEAR